MKNVLIIEDDPCISELISEGLSPNSCTQVFCLKDFESQINSNKFDFFIIDLDLSSHQYSGVDCLKLIKDKKIEGKTIVYSGLNPDEVRKVTPSADFIVEKPFLSKIKSIVGSNQKFENLTSLQVFNLLVTTYHHHFRNKLTITSLIIEKYNNDKARESISDLIDLLNDIEENKLEVVNYGSNNNGCKVLDYPLKK